VIAKQRARPRTRGASVTVAQTAVCKGGGVVFASDGDVKAIEQAWYWLTGRQRD